jgi:hypothetical protein
MVNQLKMIVKPAFMENQTKPALEAIDFRFG